jgi:hypothetical protein
MYRLLPDQKDWLREVKGGFTYALRYLACF